MKLFKKLQDTQFVGGMDVKADSSFEDSLGKHHHLLVNSHKEEPNVIGTPIFNVEKVELYPKALWLLKMSSSITKRPWQP